jgi:exonuclease III
MMQVITWNIRGINGIYKKRILRDCINIENLDVLLLQETKCFKVEAKTIFHRFWRGCESIHTDSCDALGGLSILCNTRTITMQQPFSTIHTITTYFTTIWSNKEWAITNVYGPQTL